MDQKEVYKSWVGKMGIIRSVNGVVISKDIEIGKPRGDIRVQQIAEIG